MLPNLLACAVAVLLPPAPDIIPENYHSVRVERRAEVGALQDACCVQYSIEKGDTFSTLAKQRLGSAARVGEIVALNPDVEPDRLRIGQRIWLPPRQADVEGPMRFVYASNFRGLSDASPYALGDSIYGRYGRFTFVLVPDALREGFEAAQEEGRAEVAKFEKAHRIASFAVQTVRGLVKDGSKVASISETIRVVRGEDGRFSAESEVVNYDKDGKPLGGGTDKHGEGGGLWMLLLAAAGAGLVWWRVRARGPASAVHPAVA